MTILYYLSRAVATVGGITVASGLTVYLIESQNMDYAHAIKAWVICGGVVTGGFGLAYMAGKAKAMLICGVICAEAFNIGSIAEQNWRERAELRSAVAKANADANAAYAIAKAAHATASGRLAKAEAAKAAADAVVASANRTKDCRRECMAGNIAQADKAAAEVSAARASLQAEPARPVTTSPDAAATSWQWDLAMGLIGSIGGNMIAIGLLAFGATPANGGAIHGEALPSVPSITAIDGGMADAALLNEQNRRSLSAFSMSANNARVDPSEEFAARKIAALASADRSPLAELFAGDVAPSAEVIAFPGPNGSDFPKGSGGPKGGRRVRPEAVKAEIVRLISSGERFASQEDLRACLNRTFGGDAVKPERLSVWLGELGPNVPRTTIGRCKMIG